MFRKLTPLLFAASLLFGVFAVPATPAAAEGPVPTPNKPIIVYHNVPLNTWYNIVYTDTNQYSCWVQVMIGNYAGVAFEKIQIVTPARCDLMTWIRPFVQRAGGQNVNATVGCDIYGAQISHVNGCTTIGSGWQQVVPPNPPTTSIISGNVTIGVTGEANRVVQYQTFQVTPF